MPPLAILDIGPFEMLLLAAAAVLLFGGDLPSAARKAARWVARARATLAELRSELDAGTKDLPDLKPPEELIQARDELTAHARRTREAIREAHALAVSKQEDEQASTDEEGGADDGEVDAGNSAPPGEPGPDDRAGQRAPAGSAADEAAPEPRGSGAPPAEAVGEEEPPDDDDTRDRPS